LIGEALVIEQWLISGAVVNDDQFGQSLERLDLLNHGLRPSEEVAIVDDYGYRIGHDGASHGKLASGKAVVYDTDLALGYVPRQMAKLKRLARSFE
jgi:hypothetical protein